MSNEELGPLQELHNNVRSTALTWFNSINPKTSDRILQYHGPMPDTETDYWNLPSGPSWLWWIIAVLPLDPSVQVCEKLLSSFYIKFLPLTLFM